MHSIERKTTLSNAIIELEYLIKNNILKESRYQEYFEKNPIVFEVLGYTEFYPFTKQANQKLAKDDYSNLQPEPDFIVKNDNGIFEIFEIKTPIDKKITITRNEYRKRFTAEIVNYISQTITYGDYFTRNPENRKKLQDMYDIEIQEDLPQKIIIGLSKNFDQKEVHRLCNKYKDRIDIIAYDTILNHLENDYKKHYGQYEGVPGCSIHTIIKFDKNQEKGRNYFLDIAEDTNKNRLSIYLNNLNELCLEILSSDSKSTIINLHKDTVNIFDNFVYISFEFGVLEQSFYLNISIDGEKYDERIIYFPIDIDFSNAKIFIATDINLEKWSNLKLGRFVYYDHTITFKERNFITPRMRIPFQVMNLQRGSHILVKSTPEMKNKEDDDLIPAISYGLGFEDVSKKFSLVWPPKPSPEFPYS